jgi:hypothetical protein
MDIDLENKKKALDEREKQLDEREKKISEMHLPNWPICKPFIYHSIENEIPTEARSMVRRAYFAWYGKFVISLIYHNPISSLA